LLVHCNGMKADKADAWVLLWGFAASGEWHECGNRCLTRLAESKAPGSIHRKQLPLMSSSTSNARWMTAYRTTQNGLTSAGHLLLKELHCTFQRKSKQRTKCRSTKTYLLLFQKAATTICCTGLQWTDGAVELKSPLRMNPLESVRGNKYICVSSMASHKSNLVQ
jgi:hypothetical protein